jgi:hypothetical protein
LDAHYGWWDSYSNAQPINRNIHSIKFPRIAGNLFELASGVCLDIPIVSSLHGCEYFVNSGNHLTISNLWCRFWGNTAVVWSIHRCVRRIYAVQSLRHDSITTLCRLPADQGVRNSLTGEGRGQTLGRHKGVSRLQAKDCCSRAVCMVNSLTLYSTYLVDRLIRLSQALLTVTVYCAVMYSLITYHC